jgi:hypothetical protein
MGYLIDTNILSELRKKQNANPNVQFWFSGIAGEECYISVLTIGEIVNGIKRLEPKDMNSAKNIQTWLDRVTIDFSDRILPITAKISTVWGEMTPKMPMPVVDSLLASTAIIHNLTLVTRNIKDVESSGAKLLNPFNQ